MPPIAQGICIWGSGRAVSDAVPAVPALRDMRIVYWGDMDADGLEILRHYVNQVSNATPS